MRPTTTTLAAENVLRLNLGWLDYVLVAIYFVFVLGIGFIARSQISSSLDFFLSGRRLPAWVTGLAFISANLGAVEIMGMAANGAQVGLSTMHYYWIGAVPAMLFLGVVMMPFYYGSKVRSVPEFMRRRFGPGAHLVNAISFATAQVLIAGVNLFLLATVINALVGWPRWVSLIIAAIVVLSYITLGGLSAAIYNEVLQFFVILAALVPLTIFGLITRRRLERVEGQDDRHNVRRQGDGDGQRPDNDVAGQRAERIRQPGVVGDRHRVRPRVRAVLRVLDDQLCRGAARDGLELDLVGAAIPDHCGVPEDVHPVRGDRARHDRCRRDRRHDQAENLWRGRHHVQRCDASDDPRHPAQRSARCRRRRSARLVHGGHGGQHLGVQHRVQL